MFNLLTSSLYESFRTMSYDSRTYPDKESPNALRNRDMLVGASFPATSAQSATKDSPKSKICTLNCTLEETAVLRCIESNPKITQKEMASTIHKSERTVKTITSNLVDKGIIIRRNRRRNGWWEILSK